MIGFSRMCIRLFKYPCTVISFQRTHNTLCRNHQKKHPPPPTHHHPPLLCTLFQDYMTKRNLYSTSTYSLPPSLLLSPSPHGLTKSPPPLLSTSSIIPCRLTIITPTPPSFFFTNVSTSPPSLPSQPAWFDFIPPTFLPSQSRFDYTPPFLPFIPIMVRLYPSSTLPS